MKKQKGKKKGKKKAFLAALLSAAVICQALPAYQAGAAQGADGLCSHHTEHTPECGYVAEVTGSPCTHEHTEECDQEVTACLHEHTPECYGLSCGMEEHTHGEACWGEPELICTEEHEHTEDCYAVGALICTLEEHTHAEACYTLNCAHVCSKESGCVTQNHCVHEDYIDENGVEIKAAHDETCGYVAAVAGSPCTYVCEECKKEAADAEKAQESQQKIDNVQKLISTLPEADSITAENLEDVKTKLAAIEAAKAELDETQQAALNLEKYTAAAERIAVVEAELEAAPEATEEDVNLLAAPMKPTAGNWVAMIGETGYESLQQAVDAAEGMGEATINLLADTDEVVTVSGNKNIILNGNGYKLFALRLDGYADDSVVTINADISEIAIESGTLNINGGKIGTLGTYRKYPLINIAGGEFEYLDCNAGTTYVTGGSIADIDDRVGLTFGVDSVSLSEESLVLAPEEFQTLTAAVSPQISAPGMISWSSDKEDVATVDGSGKVTAVGLGTATITASVPESANKPFASCTVTVKDVPQAPKITIDYADETLNTTTAMEYSMDGSTWTDCTENMSVSAFGWDGSAETVVQIRMKETAEASASESATVTIPARPVLTVTQVGGDYKSITVQVEGAPQGGTLFYQLTEQNENPHADQWQESAEAVYTFTGLHVGTVYWVWVKCPATDTDFGSEEKTLVNTKGAAVSVNTGGETTFYDSVPEAFAAADGQTATITLLENISGTLEDIFLNGGAITWNTNGYLYEGNIEVKGGILTAVGEGSTTRIACTGGTVNINGGTVGELYCEQAGTVNLTEGTIRVHAINYGVMNVAGGSVATWLDCAGGVLTALGGSISNLRCGGGTVILAGSEAANIEGTPIRLRDIRIDYRSGALLLLQGLPYSMLQYSWDGASWNPCTENMLLADFGWTGDAVPIRLRVQIQMAGETAVGKPAEISVPARPMLTVTQQEPILTNRITVSVEGVPQGSTLFYQLTEEGGQPLEDQWQEAAAASYTFDGLTSKTAYTVHVKCSATDSGFGAETSATVSTAAAVASVTIDGQTTEYADIEEAIKAAQDADKATLELYEDVEKPVIITGGNITIIGNGHRADNIQVEDGAVLTVVPDAVRLDKESLAMMTGDAQTLTALIETKINVPIPVVWTSDNGDVAVVDEKGSVTAIAPGTAVIKATAGGISATCTVTVTPRPTAEPTPEATATPTPTVPITPEATATPTPTVPITPEATATPTPTVPITPEATATPTPTVPTEPEATATPTPTVPVSPTASVTPTVSAAPEISTTPTVSVTPVALATPTAEPAASEPTVTPTPPATPKTGDDTPLAPLGILLLASAVIIFVIIRRRNLNNIE